CVGIKRAYVHRSIYSAVVAKVVEKTQALQALKDVGPLVDDIQLASVQEFVSDAITQGATLAAQSKADTGPGVAFFPPTVLLDVPKGARLVQEECFGPVLPIWPFDTEEQVVSEANGSAYGLGASIWTTNVEHARQLAQRLDVGMIWI